MAKAQNTEIKLDDTKETVNTFLDKIFVAKANGIEWVETSPEIINHYNRGGLNGAKYFIYDGIKVCEFGQVEAIEKEMNEQMGKKIFGEAEAVVLGRE